MSGRVWLVVCVLLGCSARDLDPSDAAVAIEAGTSDAGPPVCRVSPTPGCQETCQFFYECVVQSTIADRIGATFPGIGFTGPGYMDCTGCVERCEAGAGNDAALSCFSRIAATDFCAGGAADPTVAASAVNECCEGQLGSTFCDETCLAVSSLADYFPACEPFVAAPLPSSCAGTCPAVVSAFAIEPTGIADWSVSDVAFSADGAFAVTGFYERGALDFGDGPLPYVGALAVQYLAMFDASGAIQWSVALSQGLSLDPLVFDFRNTLAIDAAGNVTVLGALEGSVTLGAELVSAGGGDVLLARFAPDGTVRWARRFGDAATDVHGELALDGTELVFTMTFEGSPDLGGGALASAGGTDVAVVRCDANGAPLRSWRFGGPGADRAVGVAVHPSGELTVGGGYDDGADFGAGPVAAVGMNDSYVARFRGDGTLRWLETRGGTSRDYVYQVAADGEAAVIQDYFGDGGTIPVGPLTVSGSAWVMMRYEAAGSAAWAFQRELVGPGYFIAWDGDVDASGDVVFGLIARGTLDLGAGPVTTNAEDSAIARVDRDGTNRWLFRFGTRGYDPAPLVARLASGELVAAGTFRSGLDYGTGVLRSGAQAIYVLRFATE